jgi:hypothetical protein
LVWTLVSGVPGEPPPPEPQAEPVPETTPDVFTFKHWVEPEIDERVRVEERVVWPVTQSSSVPIVQPAMARLDAVATPRTGVTKVGLVFMTNVEPVPV